MYERWFGAGLLLLSLLVAGIAGVKVSYERKDWAKTETSSGIVDVKDQVVLVPSMNSSEGWVGFNFTLPNQGRTDYHASGAIEPADQDPNPAMVIAAVNQTGLDQLTSFENFDPAWWNITQVYTRSFLNSTYTYNSFEFQDLDNCSYYVLLFRGQKEEAQDRPILVSIQETWFEPGNIFQFTPWSISIIAAVAFTGSGLIIYDQNSRRRKNTLKQRQRIRNNDKDKSDLRAKKKTREK